MWTTDSVNMDVEASLFTCLQASSTTQLPSCGDFSRPGSRYCRWESRRPWEGVVECESCHGTQSTYHAKCRRECSSEPGRPSIPGKLIVINQVTETEQGLADDHLFPLPLLLTLPPPLPFLLSSSSILLCLSWCSFHPDWRKRASKQLETRFEAKTQKASFCCFNVQ